jgi:DNA ligase 1
VSLTPWRRGFASILPQQRCRGTEHLSEELERIISGGGEGVMLRQPGSRYEAGRSATLLKAKRSHDAEARVIEHQPGAGRHKGRLGALLVALPDGATFSVGTGLTDAQRNNPPAVP